ncbi:hypothetical protein [Micromonospora sp. URMC 103]|uniref:hypothetical protein n=1 Tax=Micromonospora sp. URMC 103 TaxID=3423406 RepID=UPI003F19769D
MSYSSDDLTPLFGGQPGPGVGYRQGTILEWNPATAENTVEVDGKPIQNLSILNTSESLLLAPGDVVGILTTGGAASSWCILGRLTIPGTAAAAMTLGTGLAAATVVASAAVTSAGYTLNGGPTVTTQVLRTGRVYLTAASAMDLDVGEGVALAVFGGGPNGATITERCYLTSRNLLTVSSGTLGGTLNTAASSAELVTGLTPGIWTFELQSAKTNGAAGDPRVHTRVLTVMPF